MNSHMVFHGPFFDECFWAKSTLKGPFPSVRHHVFLQMWLLFELQRAQVTLEGPFPSVDSHMLVAYIFSLEDLSAELADEKSWVTLAG